jgi:RNA polymerase sigma-70 factor (ECF subfamily)
MSTMTLKATSIKSSAVVIDKKAFEKLYEERSLEIYRYAYRMLNDNDLAEDCVADTFQRLLVSVRGGTSFENIRAYMYRIAHNWITDHYRRHPLPALELQEEMHSGSEGNPLNVVTQNLDRQRVRAAIFQLSAEQRQVIELRFVENWSHQEVADALGKSVDATRALQYRAVEALRQLLSE